MRIMKWFQSFFWVFSSANSLPPCDCLRSISERKTGVPGDAWLDFLSWPWAEWCFSFSSLLEARLVQEKVSAHWPSSS